MTRHLGRSIALASVFALPAAAPNTLHAQTQTVAWTLCIPGAFRSCHSVQLSTTPIYSGATRVGTDIAIAMHNLNGQVPDDNTSWSGLEQVYFGSSTVANWGNQSVSAPLSVSGGAAFLGYGGEHWYAGEGLDAIFAAGSFDGSMVGGCASGAWGPYAVAYLTCGPNAAVTASFALVESYDASIFDEVIVVVYGDQGQKLCSPRGTPKCEILSRSFSTIPEPLTLVLLGTGLFGIGAARLRRRKKDPQIDA